MQAEQNAKQQIVERIKNSTNILVTVGSNPSVDELSAALSLTLMLNRLDKHGTAVFSGQIPQAINFLDPGKTFENTVDSLRDFIIALDKEKADRLRYKVEDDVVRIFITPYRTVINEKDLQFSQGDFNVETIIALGVEKREDLDTAITAHGRILHDATVATINLSGQATGLGSIDWTDTAASSLCEMLMSLSEALQPGLLDQQIATALLTGIVSATDRFRNEHTSPRVMTMAAQLMAAGANQQLIAAKLEEGHEIPTPDGTTKLAEGQSQKVSATPTPPAASADGSLSIEHTPKPDAPPLPNPSSDALKEAEDELAKSLQQAAPAAVEPAKPTLSVNDLQKDLASAANEVDDAAGLPPLPKPPTEHPKIIKQERSWRTEPVSEPTFGGTLNATTEDAEEAKRDEELSHANHQLLSHDLPSGPPPEVTEEKPAEPTPLQETMPPTPEPAPVPSPLPTPPSFEPAPEEPNKPLESTDDSALSFEATPIETPHSEPTLAEIDSQTRGKAAEEARAAIDAALNSMPFSPAGQPLESAGALPVFDVAHNQPAGAPPVDVSTSAPSMTPPPLPDFSTLPPLPGEAPQTTPGVAPAAPTPVPPSAPADPGQFKIPGQP